MQRSLTDQKHRCSLLLLCVCPSCLNLSVAYCLVLLGQASSLSLTWLHAVVRARGATATRPVQLSRALVRLHCQAQQRCCAQAHLLRCAAQHARLRGEQGHGRVSRRVSLQACARLEGSWRAKPTAVQPASAGQTLQACTLSAFLRWTSFMAWVISVVSFRACGVHPRSVDHHPHG